MNKIKMKDFATFTLLPKIIISGITLIFLGFIFWAVLQGTTRGIIGAIFAIILIIIILWKATR